MTPSGIEQATFRFVAQYLNHCATISGPITGVLEANYLHTSTAFSVKEIKLSRRKIEILNVWCCERFTECASKLKAFCDFVILIKQQLS
jgi:hypothetical protein